MNGREIVFKTHGNEKQKDCARAWLDNNVTEIVYGGSKSCFAKGTLVNTSRGLIPINEIKAGDFVYSLNETSKEIELKEVLKSFAFGGNSQSKMIIFVLKNGTRIKCTHNHEFYFEGIWQPAYRLAERAMVITETEYAALKSGWEIKTEFFQRMQTKESVQRFAGMERKINRATSYRNQTEIQAQKIHAGNVGKGIWSKSVNNQRCDSQALEARCITLDEILEVKCELSTEVVYDLHVSDNHNYIITSEKIIVHNSGKSYLGCSLIFGDALIYPETHYFIARKRLNDLRKFTIPSIYEVFQHWEISDKYYRFDGKDSFFELYNKSKVYLIEASLMPSDPLYQRFGSMQMTRGWIEEAGEFEADCKNNLQASIGRWKNDVYGLTAKLLQTCNPSKNYLYYEYYQKHKNGTLENWKRFIQALPSDNKKLSSGYIENLERSLSQNQRERLLLGNWEYDDDPDSLCEYTAILDIFTNELPTGQKYITADVARFGSDKAIIAVWDGWNVIELVIFETSRTTEIQNAIQALKVKHKVGNRNIVADEDGVGGGVVDSLAIEGFVNNSKSLKDENYFNLQSQCCYKLAERINSNQIAIKCDISEKHKAEIIEDLEQLKSYNMDKDGKVRILPKEKVKDILGRSPDWRDVLMMREYFELKLTGGMKVSGFADKGLSAQRL